MMVVDAAAVADLADLDSADRVAELRRRLAAMPGGGPPAAARSTAPAAPRPSAPAAPPRSTAPPAAPVHPEGPGDVAPVVAGPAPVASAPAAPTGVAASAPVARPTAGPAAAVPGVAVPESVAHLVPGGVLPAGRVTAVSGSATLRVGLLAAATASGARCAVVGWPELGVAAVAEQGGRLDCLALVPDPGPDPAAVVSVLLDGLDLVLLGPGVAAVAPSRARVIAGRVRAAGAVLLVGPGWPGAELTLAGRPCRYGGLGAGAGRLASVSTLVRSSGRAAPVRTAEWVAAG
ncbi:hypothetical protein [Dietzia sp. CH92]|uniref:hypothetical protein n=1 Tax=Dietzia sp. CH92 TaxID=3051823 RepID=UPI0028D2B771|nr:hypothetical protein [Dietzia sp. CH92]